MEPSRNIPTFEMPLEYATLEASGPQEASHFVGHISAGPALEFLQVVDDSFVISYQAAWFSQPPTVSRVGTLKFQLAPNVFGSTQVHVSLTARTADGTSYRTNTQYFNLGKRVPDAPNLPHLRKLMMHLLKHARRTLCIAEIEAVNDAPSFTLNSSLNTIDVSEDACSVQSPCTVQQLVTHAQPGGSLLNQYWPYDWNETSQSLSFAVWHHAGQQGTGGGQYFSLPPQVDADSLELKFATALDFSGMLDMRILVKVSLHVRRFRLRLHVSVWTLVCSLVLIALHDRACVQDDGGRNNGGIGKNSFRHTCAN